MARQDGPDPQESHILIPPNGYVSPELIVRKGETKGTTSTKNATLLVNRGGVPHRRVQSKRQGATGWCYSPGGSALGNPQNSNT